MDYIGILNLIIVFFFLGLVIFIYIKFKQNKIKLEKEISDGILKIQEDKIISKIYREQLKEEPLSQKLIEKELQNKKLIEEINDLEKKYNKIYFRGKDDIGLYKDDDDNDEIEEYINFWVTELAELYLGANNFEKLYDNFCNVDGIGEVFWEDREVFLINEKTCMISNKAINIEFLNIYLKLLLENLNKGKPNIS